MHTIHTKNTLKLGEKSKTQCSRMRIFNGRTFEHCAKLLEILRVKTIIEIFGHLHTMNALIWTFHTVVFSVNAPVSNSTHS